jgi:2-dehydropantoate 2-reductase
MRTLVVGAGAIGGYFGGRLLEINRDVTFLVRPKRAAELASQGLIVRSPRGDVAFSKPSTVLAENLRENYDLVILSCKAYDLEDAITSFAPGVGPNTVILPLLNGIRHLDVLDERVGRDRVLGGQCFIAVALKDGEIVHLVETHELSFGERNGELSDRVQAIAQLMEGARFKAHASAEILQEMWEKWVFLASLAGGTCLMRANIRDICVSPGGTDFMLGLLEDCRSIASAEGFPVREAQLNRTRKTLTATGSALTASMLRDIERNAPIEGEHIVGDLLRRRGAASSPGKFPYLTIAHTHLKAYEARRTQTIQPA